MANAYEETMAVVQKWAARTGNEAVHPSVMTSEASLAFRQSPEYLRHRKANIEEALANPDTLPGGAGPSMKRELEEIEAKLAAMPDEES